MYLAAILKDGRHVRVVALGFDSPDAALTAFVNHESPYNDDFVQVDRRGEGEFIARSEIATVRGSDGESLLGQA